MLEHGTQHIKEYGFTRVPPAAPRASLSRMSRPSASALAIHYKPSVKQYVAPLPVPDPGFSPRRRGCLWCLGDCRFEPQPYLRPKGNLSGETTFANSEL